MSTKDSGVWIPDQTMGDYFFTACRRFITDEAAFNTFKTNHAFCTIIGNDVREKAIADQLYNFIFSSPQPFLDKLDAYKTNDKYGTPVLYNYTKTGPISPGTLYFINVLQQLLDQFGDISNMNVVEIGSGYGGQAKIILDYGVKNYTCIDVVDTLALCKKYLGLYEYPNVDYSVWDSLEDKEYDLVISNWCLSEFDEAGVQYYMDKVVSKSKCGFFLMNVWDKPRKDYIMNAAKKLFSYVEATPEVPKTNPNDNFLLIVKDRI